MAQIWARCLHTPYLPGNTQRSARVKNQKWHKWQKSGQDGSITHAFLGVPCAKHWGGIRNGPNLGKVPT